MIMHVKQVNKFEQMHCFKGQLLLDFHSSVLMIG